MGKIQICPVCQGRGIVPNGFYMVPANHGAFTNNNAGPEVCRTCSGQGTVSEPVGWAQPSAKP